MNKLGAMVTKSRAARELCGKVGAQYCFKGGTVVEKRAERSLQTRDENEGHRLIPNQRSKTGGLLAGWGGSSSAALQPFQPDMFRFIVEKGDRIMGRSPRGPGKVRRLCRSGIRYPGKEDQGKGPGQALRMWIARHFVHCSLHPMTVLYHQYLCISSRRCFISPREPHRAMTSLGIFCT